MGIDAAGDGGGAMAQRLADVEHRHAQVVGDGGEAVAQVMEPDLFKPIILEELREQLGYSWGGRVCRPPSRG